MKHWYYILFSVAAASTGQKRARIRGFTLLEISIVLTVLALLVGGLVASSNVIRNGQLRAVVSEKNRWVSATSSFKEKYAALPGDMPNATSYWGASTSTMCSTNASATISDTGTCNGNGDTKVIWCSDTGSGVYTCKEIYWYWQHLALAGMIEGKYRGSGRGSATDHYPGDTDPGSRIDGGATWAVFSDRNGNNTDANYDGIGKNEWYSVNYGNSLIIRGQGHDATTGVLTPTEAASIDAKIDDGMPGTGQVIGKWWNNSMSGAWGANRCTTSANSQDFTGTYNFALDTKICDLYFVRQF